MPSFGGARRVTAGPKTGWPLAERFVSCGLAAWRAPPKLDLARPNTDGSKSGGCNCRSRELDGASPGGDSSKSAPAHGRGLVQLSLTLSCRWPLGSFTGGNGVRPSSLPLPRAPAGLPRPRDAPPAMTCSKVSTASDVSPTSTVRWPT